jgi:hypothetical protein
VSTFKQLFPYLSVEEEIRSAQVSSSSFCGKGDERLGFTVRENLLNR